MASRPCARLTYGVQAAERGVRGSVRALAADDGPLGVGGVVTRQGLMVRVGGLSVRVALRRRIGASVAGDGLLAAWRGAGGGGVSDTRTHTSLRFLSQHRSSWFSYLNVCGCVTTTTPSCVVVTRVLAVVAGLVEVAEVKARGQVPRRHRRPPRVGVQQQQGLVVALDAARDHVLPLGADLQETRRFSPCGPDILCGLLSQIRVRTSQNFRFWDQF